MYTVTFKNSLQGSIELSRYFTTKAAAMKWAKWLRTRSFVEYAEVYRGQAGEELIERFSA